MGRRAAALSPLVALTAVLALWAWEPRPAHAIQGPDHCEGCEVQGGPFDLDSDCIFQGETYYVRLNVSIASGNCVTDITSFECGAQKPCEIDSTAMWKLPVGVSPNFCISTQSPPWTYCATGQPATGEPQELDRKQPQACDGKPHSYAVSGQAPCGPLIALTAGLTCTECLPGGGGGD